MVISVLYNIVYNNTLNKYCILILYSGTNFISFRGLNLFDRDLFDFSCNYFEFYFRDFCLFCDFFVKIACDSFLSNISNISLVIIYSQLKLYTSELLTKIDNVKDDILAQLQNENQCLEGEFTELEKEA